jgi:hypothetical protein
MDFFDCCSFQPNFGIFSRTMEDLRVDEIKEIWFF